MLQPKSPTLPLLIFDIALLFCTPLVLGIGGAVAFFFFYPLPAILLGLYLHYSRVPLRLKKIQHTLHIPLTAARLIIFGVLLLGFFGSSVGLPSFGTIGDPQAVSGDGSFLSLLFLS